MTKEIPLFGVVKLPEIEASALEVLRSGRIASGEYVAKFENGLGNLLGQPEVVTTIDMTSALCLALYLAGVGEGDEVLTTAFACLSTNSAIAQRNARPVWVDVSRLSVEMDVNDFSSKISKKTKAVILYHVAGYPGPAAEIAKICRERGIVLIEDCDNALLATRDSVYVGSQGDFAVYSFYPNRQINTTEGGALVCRDTEMANRARRLRRFGINMETFRTAEGEINKSSDILEIGWGASLNNLCSAIGYAQLSSVQDRQSKTHENAQKLDGLIEPIGGITSLGMNKNSTPAYWAYLVLINNRDKVLSYLKRSGVMASCLHMRNDIYTGFGVSNTHQLPNTSYLQEHILALPCGWWLKEEDVEFIGIILRECESAGWLS